MLQGRMHPDTYQKFFSTTSPLMPAFPSFTEMLTNIPKEEERSRSLYEELIGDPMELFTDYIERPESYPHELLPLLLALMSGHKTTKNLTSEEANLLNQATTLYAERSPNSNPSAEVKPIEALKHQESDKDPDLDEEEIPWAPNDVHELSLDDLPADAPIGWWKNSF